MDIVTSPLRLPQNISELNAEWLTSALARNYPGVEVSSVYFGTVSRGANTRVRLLLTYNEAGHSYRLPPTMWAKCNFEVHGAQVSEVSRSEVVFYLRRADKSVNVAKCYFAGVDDETGGAFLLLEDLLARNATFGTALQPIDPNIARRAVEMLARYHASSWNSPELAYLGPTSGATLTDDWAGLMLDESSFQQCMLLPRFEYVPEPLRSRDIFRNVLDRLWDSNLKAQHCILHGDLHLGNCFFEVDGAPGFVDWQGDTRGCWAYDFTEFVLTALDIDARRQNERALLDAYLQQLRACAVDAPSFDEAWLLYRRNANFVGFCSAVCPPAMQKEAVCIAYTERGMAAVTDLAAVSSFDA